MFVTGSVARVKLFPLMFTDLVTFSIFASVSRLFMQKKLPRFSHAVTSTDVSRLLLRLTYVSLVFLLRSMSVSWLLSR